jgi:hypothetical protein
VIPNLHPYQQESRHTTTQTTSFFQNLHSGLNPQVSVFGGRQPDNGKSNGFDDGGKWLIGVHPLSDGRLAGFFHAETDCIQESIQITPINRLAFPIPLMEAKVGEIPTKLSILLIPNLRVQVGVALAMQT